MSDGGPMWDDDNDAEEFDTGIDIPDVPEGDTQPAEAADEATDDDSPGRLASIREGFDGSEINRPEPDYSKLGAWGASVVSLIPKPLLGVRATLYKRLFKKSLQNYYKASPGDAIAINAKPGQQIDLEPVGYRTPEEVDEGEKPGWKVKGRDKVWKPTKEGNSVNYLAKTPTVLLEDDEHVEAGWLAPRIGQAIEMDQYWPLFDVNEINAEITAVVDDANLGGPNPAVPDGGSRAAEVDLSINGLAKWSEDNIIDLGSGSGYDGMRISASKAREWQAEHTDSEHMQMQEDRGYLRGLANGDEGPGMVKILLICMGIILGTLAIVLLGPEVVGGGGGGGGGINPLMATGLTGL